MIRSIDEMQTSTECNSWIFPEWFACHKFCRTPPTHLPMLFSPPQSSKSYGGWPARTSYQPRTAWGKSTMPAGMSHWHFRSNLSLISLLLLKVEWGKRGWERNVYQRWKWLKSPSAGGGVKRGSCAGHFSNSTLVWKRCFYFSDGFNDQPSFGQQITWLVPIKLRKDMKIDPQLTSLPCIWCAVAPEHVIKVKDKFHPSGALKPDKQSQLPSLFRGRWLCKVSDFILFFLQIPWLVQSHPPPRGRIFLCTDFCKTLASLCIDLSA